MSLREVSLINKPFLLYLTRYLTRSPSALIYRLTLRNQHLLALRISHFLKLSVEPVLRQWAHTKVAQSKNDQDDGARVCNVIVKRLKEESEKSTFGVGEVSCADVARTAWEDGKTVLATKVSPCAICFIKHANYPLRWFAAVGARAPS